jgi:hypothetical protein
VLTLTFATGAPAPVTGGRPVQAWSTDTGEVYARAYAAGDRRWIDWPGVATFAFSAAPVIAVWPAPGASNAVVEDTFFRVLQPVVLQAIGLQALHASAITIDGRVVALCGRSGSGKSTLAYALGRDGGQWADDAVVLERTTIVSAIGLPFAPRLRASARRYFRQTDAPVIAGATVRRPLAAVLVLDQQPRLSEQVRCRRLPTAEAFRHLLTHAHCFDPANPVDTRRLIDDYSAVADLVPVYSLSYRPAFDELPAVMRAVHDVLPSHPAIQEEGVLCESR